MDELSGRLEPIVTKAVATAGFELEALEIQPAGRRKLIKVIVDGEDGIRLDEVAEINRTVSAALDSAERFIAGSYTLEVTSPGLARPLRLPRHWRRAHTRLVNITLHDGTCFTGRVGSVGERTVRLLVDGELRDVAYEEVVSAVIEVEFNPPPAQDLKLLDDAAYGMINTAKVNQKEESE